MAGIRVGVVGTGAVATEHVREYHSREDSGTTIVAVADAVPDRAEEFARSHSLFGAAAFGSLEDMLRVPDLDVVEICTPPSSHRDLIRTAVDAGVAVLCEKPVAADLDTAHEIVDIERSSSVPVGVMQNYRYFPEYRCAREFIEMDAIGDINLVSLTVAAHWYGGTAYRLAAERMIFIELGVHYVDLIRYVTGADVVGVFASMGRGLNSPARGETFGSAVFEMSNGAIANLVITGEAPGSATNWAGQALIQGAEGVIRITRPRALDMYAHRWGGRISREFGPEGYGTHTSSTFAVPLRDYYRSWAEFGRFPVSVSDHVNTLAGTLACYRSFESGQKVPVEAVPPIRAVSSTT
jgi:predicted dehydrogenase